MQRRLRSPGWLSGYQTGRTLNSDSLHIGFYSQWGCIESWPLVEVDECARPDDLPAWVVRIEAGK